MAAITHDSVYVAPLQIQKVISNSSAVTTTNTNDTNLTIQRLNGQITPPLTPEDDTTFDRQADFQAYIRAFYPYNPSFENEATVTLPLNIGDVILVHSIHTNGWADGTLLSTGARGWLPTNYCEGYHKESISTLLSALTVFWDLVKSTGNGDYNVLRTSDYVRGLVAGVRCLLVRGRCSV